MLRRLFRLLVFAAILALVAWAVSRFLNREEDFEDYDDIDSTLDFTETPVEIDVSYDAGTATETPSASTESGTAELSTEETAPVMPEASSAEQAAPDTTEIPVAEPSASDNGVSETTEGGSVIDVNGIGPTYAARLKEIGIDSLSDLAGASADDIAGKIEVIGGRSEVQDWIEQAQKMTSGAS